MDQIRNYLFSIIVSAVLCSLIQNLLHNFHTKSAAKIICGIILTLSILQPIKNWKIDEIHEWNILQFDEAQEAAAVGQYLFYSAQADIIKLKTEAYILDKAAELGADISVTITIADSKEPVPVRAEITGDISPFVQKRLEKILEEDLNISKENLQWNG